MSDWSSTRLALASACVALAGGVAWAGAPPTIRCVNRTDPICVTTHATIQEAVNASSSGDLILVGAGTYNEAVLIDRTVNLYGARAGLDARRRPNIPSLESIVDGSGTGTSTIIVQASDVVIDGFTVQGGVAGNATGIDLKGSGGGSPGFTPAHRARVVNNIMQNNSTGLSLNSEGFGPVTHALVERNLFRNNNAGVPAVAGDGIFTSACQHVAINDNLFTGHLRLGIGINNSTNVTITHNESDGDARFVVYTGTTDSELSNNRVRNLIISSLFSNTRAAGISVRNGNSRLTISNNLVGYAEAGSIIRGIQFGGGSGPEPANTNLVVANNRFHDMSLHGMVAESAMLTNSHLIGNMSVGNAGDGILIAANNGGNVVTENRFRHNSVADCIDQSTGGGSAGTANTWFENTGLTNSPGAVCDAPKLTMSCSPNSFTAGTGFFIQSTQCTISSVGGFTGTVGLVCNGEPHPQDVGCIMNPRFVTVPANGSVTAQLVVGGAQMRPGVYSVYGLAANTTVFESRDLRLTITP